MKKIFMLFMLLCVSNIFAGYAFPTIDGSRGPWLEKDYFPIILESGFHIGLTNPHVGETHYKWIFHEESGDLTFTVPSPRTEPDVKIRTDVVNRGLFLGGVHYGTGNPLNADSVLVTGYGVMSCWEFNFDEEAWYYEGDITVIPEPSTLILLFAGILLMRKRVK